MKTPGRALLLVGSFKRSRSTSFSLGSYLLSNLEHAGVKTSNTYIHSSMKSEKKQKDLMRLVGESDLIILSCPLYVDSLPYPVIRFMESSAAEVSARKERSFMAIVNGGFPESSQSDIAIDICRNYSSEAGFDWAGGLAFGGGGSIDGRPVADLPAFMSNVATALETAAVALANGDIIPEKAVALARHSATPKSLYRFFGNRGWKRKAKKNKVNWRMRARPYADR